LFLSTVSLLPIPGIDGGPILKWSLVERGHSVEEAEEAVRSVNGLLALAAALLAGLAFRRRKTLIGVILGMFSLSSLGIFLGWIQEEKIPW
jgi:MYXO-CTERM domain-containing protein